MSHLSQHILGTISEKNIQPISKWKFILKNLFFWAGTLFSIFLGIIVLTIFFLIFQELDIWTFLQENPALLLSIGVFVLFFFWGIMSVIFLFLSKIFLSHTKKGYRYSLPLIVTGILFFQIFSGYAFANIESVEEVFKRYEHHLPFIDTVEEEREKIWSHPESGFLIGEITEISDNFFLLKGKNGRKWKIFYSKNTFVPHKNILKEGEKIRIRGILQNLEKFIFQADAVLPYKGRREKQKYSQNKKNHVPLSLDEMKKHHNEMIQEKIQEKEISENIRNKAINSFPKK